MKNETILELIQDKVDKFASDWWDEDNSFKS